MKNKEIDLEEGGPGEVTRVTMVALAQALRDSIPRDKARENAFRVLDYLAAQTLAGAVQEGGIPTKDIYLDLGGNPNLQPSAWVSPLWKSIEEKVFDQIAPTLVARCRNQGLSHYPRPVQRPGNPARYLLEAVAIDAAAPEAAEPLVGVHEFPTHSSVTYEQDMALKLSWSGRLVFGSGINWTLGKRVILAVLIIIVLLYALVSVGLAYLLLVQNRAPFSGADLATALILVGAPGILLYQMNHLMHFFDDRIALAPEWALAWREYGVTLEFEGEREGGGTRTVKAYRYTATCPLCGGMLKLDRGEPDFPRRLVGRCIKSPREHVYSFDRVTRRGKVLVSPD